MAFRLVAAPAAQPRIAVARAWLQARAPAEEVVVVAASADAANELLRGAALARGAAFGWHRTTLPGLARTLADPELAHRGRVPVGRLATEAVTARALHPLRIDARLGRFEAVAEGPGLVGALAGALEEVRLARITPAALEKEAPELARLHEAFEAALMEAGLVDRAGLLACAVAAAEAGDHPLLGLPLLWLDAPCESRAEQALVAALAARAPEGLATLPCGDVPAASHLSEAFGVPVETLPSTSTGGLARLQTHLFEGTAPEPTAAGDEVVVLSAPGESRECVEIARRIQQAARAGTAFDRIAVLLRSADEYRAHLVEAFARAGIDAHFARGAVGPHPAGRAFVALLTCAAEGLSANRFAEYLSLAEVPDAAADGAPPAAPEASLRWIAPDEELLAEGVAAALASASTPVTEPADVEPAPDAPVAGGSLRAPRRWERLLGEAAVIGGRARWRRRLDGLAGELEQARAALEDEDDPAVERIARDAAALAALREYALPLLDDLAGLPQQADWGTWIDALSALATRALRHPGGVQRVLAELAPMAPVGPVDLAEVRLVLSRRLLEVAEPPGRSRYGKVFVGTTDAARGLGFDLVFVPGLAEKLFPRKIQEEPILLDETRARLGAGLATNEVRLARERRALRLAVGAASDRLVLSYPRLDLDQGRPRVPSFYALEALRAAEGSLPGFERLAARAETVGGARVGWPAPRAAADAIDEAEHDLALLETLRDVDPERSVGTARYLLDANPHLGRALRFRARRWLENWTQADGLVPPPRGPMQEEVRAAIAAHALSARSYSPTALQHYAACPYKFFLSAVQRLAPREVPEAIEELDPLQRGSLVHDVQFELSLRLRERGLLPVTVPRVPAARELLDAVLDETAERYRDDLAPAIDRVWRDGVEAVRADLRELLRRESERGDGWEPWRFELSFGLGDRRARDPESVAAPVEVEGGLLLRGAIDLIERRGERVRVTDYKTGKERFPATGVVAGGQVLQPVLYALVVERLFADAQVESGRLYYCTASGGFVERSVPLDETARESARTVARVVGEALAEPFLPAAPDRGACRWCDYNVVCGPYEELRTGRKWQPRLAPLHALRELP